jgi:hypothetical protein
VRRSVRRRHDCSFMKRLFSSANTAEIGLLRDRLETAGIACEVRNEFLSPAMPGTPFDPELWVLNDEQFAEASNLLAAWRDPSPSGPSTH